MPRPLETPVTLDGSSTAEVASAAAAPASSVGINSRMVAKTPKKTTKRLPAALRDELRRTIAIKCYDTIYSMPSMKVSEQHSRMYKLYHGDNNNIDAISNLDLFCKGLSPFDNLFDDAELTNIVDGNAANTVPTQLKELKMLYSRKDKRYLLPTDINKEILEQRDFTHKTLITGRQLLETAKRSLNNIKKACA